ncbi:MAG: hypothetical protein HQK86_02000 [Nitrospinae bacterium]|nr:hypothetical protein [Nitrospinota bacterium]MBF0634501.1 hypothetical protein [Nitrospinota bacterium]
MRLHRLFAIAVSVAVLPASLAWSMPNYARQQGISCFACHTQPNVGALANNGKNSADISSLLPKGAGSIKSGVSVYTSPSTQPTWSDLVKAGREPASQPGVANTDFKQTQGISAYMTGDSFYASLSLLNARFTQFKDSISIGQPQQSVWFKFAYTPTIAGLNLAMSVFGETMMRQAEAGESNNLYGRASSLKADSVGLDAQAQGAFGGLLVNLKAMYMNSGSPYGSLPLKGETRILNSVTDGYGASARIGGQTFGLNAAYRTYKGTAGNAEAFENAATIGAELNIANKITLKSQYTSYGPSLDTMPKDGAFSLWLISGF